MSSNSPLYRRGHLQALQPLLYISTIMLSRLSAQLDYVRTNAGLTTWEGATMCFTSPATIILPSRTVYKLMSRAVERSWPVLGRADRKMFTTTRRPLKD